MGPSSPPARLVAATKAKVGSIPTRAHGQSVGEGLRERLQDMRQSLRHGSPVSKASFISSSFRPEPRVRKLLGAGFGGPRAQNRTVRCHPSNYFFHFLPPLLGAAPDVRF